MKLTLLAFILALFSSVVFAGNPKCDGPNNWAANMAFVHLKNAGLVHNETTDFTKTKVVRIASEKIGKDLYRQVHLVTFMEKSGEKIKIIMVNDASQEECSMSGVEVFLVSKMFGGLNE